MVTGHFGEYVGKPVKINRFISEWNTCTIVLIKAYRKEPDI